MDDEPLYRFIFPEATPSNNRVMRLHYFDRKRENERVHWIVRSLVGPQKQADALKRCHVEITRYGARQLDDDNLAGGFKFLLDAIVNNKLIFDDRPTCIVSKKYSQERTARKSEKTEVKIYRVNDENFK